MYYNGSLCCHFDSGFFLFSVLLHTPRQQMLCLAPMLSLMLYFLFYPETRHARHHASWRGFSPKLLCVYGCSVECTLTARYMYVKCAIITSSLDAGGSH